MHRETTQNSTQYIKQRIQEKDEARRLWMSELEINKRRRGAIPVPTVNIDTQNLTTE
jgi:hypothetical protein